MPGKYTVTLEKREEQAIAELAPAAPFEVEPLNFASLPVPDREAVMAFARKTGELQRAALGALDALSDGLGQVAIIKRVIEQTPTLPLKLRQDARSLELKLVDLREKFTGDPTRSRRNEPASVGLIDRIETIIDGHWTTTSAPTNSHRKNYDIAAVGVRGGTRRRCDRSSSTTCPRCTRPLRTPALPGRQAASCRSGRSEPTAGCCVPEGESPGGPLSSSRLVDLPRINR